MIDLHCHLLPYVDDGAHDLDEAVGLLSLEAEQGVTELCFTPHLRGGMFETPDEKIVAQFERLAPIAAKFGIKTHLSREYHFDELLLEKLNEGTVIPIGKKVLLTEFSAAHGADKMLRAAERIGKYGYVPMIAHAERYPVTDPALIRDLRSVGALIQINADSVLGYDGKYVKRLCRSLLEDGLVDVIASDAHSATDRPPRMRECYDAIGKKYGAGTAKKLVLHAAKEILATN